MKRIKHILSIILVIFTICCIAAEVTIKTTCNPIADGVKLNSDNIEFFFEEFNPLYIVVDLSGGTSAASYPVTTLSEVPAGGWTDEYMTTKLVLRKITAGKMPRTDVDITLTKDYYVGVFEVTQKQWKLVMGSNPSIIFDGDTLPVEKVSYDNIRGSSNGSQWPASNAVDATSFMGKLRAKTGIDFDLPTEAQWEYACRAGSSGDWGLLANGLMGTLNAMGWYEDNSNSKTHAVGTKTPNAWGLYDMHGNVFEWCLDWYGSLYSGTGPVGATAGSLRVLRGGSWYYSDYYCGSTFRYHNTPGSRYSDFGLRVAAPAGMAQIYEVTFNANGGEGTMPSQTFTHGVEQALSANVFTREGYTFAGWATSADGTIAYTSGESISVTAPMTLYAVWEANTYEVNFNANGGEGTMSSQTFTHGVEQVLSANAFTREGHTFAGWATSADGEVAYTARQSISVSTPMTLYAVWEPNTYSVRFNANGGVGEMSNQSFTYGIPKNLSKNSFSKEGYTFIGWSLTPSGDVEFVDCDRVINLSSEPNACVNLYAIWRENDRIVVFDSCGGEGVMEDFSINSEFDVKLPSCQFYKKDGVFLGWSMLPYGDIIYTDRDIINIPADIKGLTLYAVWAEKRYLIVDLKTGAHSYTNSEPAGGWTDEYKTEKLVFAKIPVSKFLTSQITNSFYMSIFEVTRAQVPTNTYNWGGNCSCDYDEKICTHPFGADSFDDMGEFSQYDYENPGVIYLDNNWFDNEDFDFSIPTEEQWVYAYSYNDMTEEYGWIPSNSRGDPHNVGLKKPNNFGLYDMAGNVAEITREGYGPIVGDGATFSWYGGSYAFSDFMYSTHERYFREDYGGEVGLRLVLEQDSKDVFYVTFDANGGEGVMSDQSFVFEEKQALSANAFTRDGYGFAGWATSADGPVAYTDTQSVHFYAPMTLYAVWELNRLFEAGEDGDYIVSGYTNVYDGVGHGISIFVDESINAQITYSLDGKEFVSEMPLLTNVCEQTVWYKLEAEGYLPMTNMAQVVIKPRPVTLTSGSASKVYDGTPLTKHEVAVSGDGFVAGEGASYAYTGSQTVAGSSDNAFSYTLNANTLASNYVITTVNGKLTLTQSVIKPEDIFGSDPAVTPLSCEKTYNGVAQPVEVVPEFDEEYTFLWSLNGENESLYLETAPTLKNVADGELLVYFKMVTANFEPYYGKVIFKILPRELTEDMVVLTDEAFFFDPDSGQKTPSVTVADTLADGTVISTTADYEIAYGDSTSAGAIPVIVTAKNNYFGQVTKTFDVLKRPVAPPVIGAKAYNGRTQKATITTDSRWKVVENNGGINAGEYDVILRLTNTSDYMWKGLDNDAAEWTGVFVIRKGNNGWSRYPGINSWTSGETPSEPVGQPRYGELSIAYRRSGASIATETATKPTAPGKYIARFWVDETDNFIGVATTEPYYEVEFEIYQGDVVNTHTQTTGIPVPYTWLEPYLEKYGSGDYEIAGNAKGANGYYLWESYLVGLDPEDPTSRFLANIEMLPDGMPKVSWMPDLSEAEEPRTYTVWGKEKLDNEEWTPVTSENKDKLHFFKVTVEME